MTDRFDKSVLLARFDQIHEEVKQQQTTVAPRFADAPKLPERRIHPLLYLPVEVKARELHAKAILARQAADAGMRVVIGAIWAMHMWARFLPPGIVLFKTMNKFDAENMVLWSGYGHMIAALDEEIFGVTPSRGYLAATTHPHAAAMADLVCAQGPAYARAFPYPARPAVTGTPRTLTYKQVGGGDDILVCLQFGNINNNGRSYDKMVADTLGLCASLATEDGAAWAKILRDSIAQECDVLPLMRQTIDALAEAFPTRRIVVRPHPVEDPSLWTFIQPNVFIDQNHSVLESMATSAVAVYVSGCTTGLDAYLSGLPAVRLGSGGHGVSAHMNAPVMTPSEAVEAVRRAQKWTGKLDDFFAPLTLVPALKKLWEHNRATGTAAISGKVNVVPQDVHLRKFPNTTAAEVEALVGKPVREIGWNTFLI